MPPNQASAGAPSDADTFSTRFSELAQRTLNEASPLAAKRQIGFQLVNRNEAGDRACGVFGIDLGGKLSLAPVFFLNGETKADCLVHTNPDLFVPLTDDWVRAALRDSIDKVGEPVDRQEARRFQRPLDMRPVMNPGYRKVAGVTDPLVAIEFAKLCDRMKKQARYVPKTLPEFLKDTGADYYRAFVKLAVKFPQFLTAVDRVFGNGTTTAIAKTASELLVPPPGPSTPVSHSPSPSLLQPPPVLPHINDPVADHVSALAGSQQSQPMGVLPMHRPAAALSGGLISQLPPPKPQPIVADKPGEDMDVAAMAKVAGAKGGPLVAAIGRDKDAEAEGEVAIVTPRSVARVHANKGKFPDNVMGAVATRGYHAKDTRKNAAKAVKEVDVNSIYTQSPTESGFFDVLLSDGYKRLLVLLPGHFGQSTGTCLVIDTDSNAWEYAPAADVVVKLKDPLPFKEEQRFHAWAADLGKFKKIPDDYDTKFLLVAADGKCWGPFNGSGMDTASTRHGHLSYADPHPSTSGSRIASSFYNLPSPLTLTYMPDAEGNKPVLREDAVYVPSGVGVIELKKDKRTLEIVGPQEFRESVKRGTVKLAVKKVAGSVRINGRDYDPRVAPVELMLSWDLREKQANQIITEGGSYYVFPPVWLVNRVAQYEKTAFDFGTFAPPVPEQEFVNEQAGRQALPTAYRQETSQAVTMPGQPPPRWDPWAAEDQQTMMSHVTNSAKENPDDRANFSTASIAALLNEVDGPDAVSRGAGDIVKAIHQLGTDLFLLRWHRDDFDTRYGSADAQKLEDLVRTNFLQLGKTSLRLNQKGVGQNSSYEERD